MASRHRKNSGYETERTCPSSHVNYRYLSLEKDKRMANLHTELAKEKRQVALLREKVKKFNEEKGVQVDQELSDDLGGIMNDITGQAEIRGFIPVSFLEPATAGYEGAYDNKCTR